MSKTVKVKKHVRDGVTIEAHERVVSDGEVESLNQKVKDLSANKKKKQKLGKLLFGGKKWGDSR